MELHLLSIPDNADALAAWLEECLLGPDLGEVAAELAAVYDAAPADAPALEEALAGRLPAVLAHGLRGLPAALLGRLLRHPTLLLDLQERVLTEGGEPWRRPCDSRLLETTERGRDRLAVWVHASGNGAGASPLPSPVTTDDRPAAAARSVPVRPRATSFWRQTLIASLASAACAVLAVFAFETLAHRETPSVATPAPAAPPRGWGWMNDAALAAAPTAPEHLRQLADAAHEWFNRRPTDAAALGHRLGEFRQGCTQLLLAEHAPLAEPDRAWLRERCRAWAAKLDTHLAALESGAAPATVLPQADDTITRLIQALRTRAEELEQS